MLKSLDDPYHKAHMPAVKEGFFKPEFTQGGEPKANGTFVIPIPPPNVTGKLHCGHALATSLQDLLVRWHRMQGYTTLYLPGCDHAAIPTQAVVENMLWRQEKKTRHDLGRPQFLETTLAWVDEYKGNITAVLKRLGGSFDWTRKAFTMINFSTAVIKVFVCKALSTALSTLEVDHKELTGHFFPEPQLLLLALCSFVLCELLARDFALVEVGERLCGWFNFCAGERVALLDVPGYDRKIEFGVLTHFKHPIEGTNDEYIEIATTRPETMLGDTAIAVHPDDERYRHLLGKHAKHPFLNRLLPIITDDYVDKEFGTGAVKITVCHILNDDGTMNHNAGKFQGHKRFGVRFLVTQELTDLGLCQEGGQPHVHAAKTPLNLL
ncbi:hypothetical protein HBH69_219630 [Parastagonospora nodorum]|nr:hypothetical protein HBH69_219630 [Parastagonospora nodorum]KAH6383530.1 hypothetical protein HBI08_212800 [Parastagonospora nodorum]